MISYPIATELSYAVLQRRTRLGELSAPELNPANQDTQQQLLRVGPVVFDAAPIEIPKRLGGEARSFVHVVTV